VCEKLYYRVINELKKAALKPDIMFRLLDNTVDILGGVHQDNLKLSPSIEIRPLVSELRHSNETRYQETAQKFVEQFADRK